MHYSLQRVKPLSTPRALRGDFSVAPTADLHMATPLLQGYPPVKQPEGHRSQSW